VADTEQEVNLLGGTTAAEEINLREEAEETPWHKHIQMAYNSQNSVAALGQLVQRKSIPGTPGFDPTSPEIWNEYKTRVPRNVLPALATAQSRAEMDETIRHYEQNVKQSQELSRSGYSGLSASLIGGLVDVDVLAAPFTGGATVLPKLSKMARMTRGGRLENITNFAQAGAEAGALVESVNIGVRPEGDLDSLPTAIVGSAALAGVFGSVLPNASGLVDDVNRSMRGIEDEAAAAGGDTVYDSVGAARNALAPEGGDIILRKPKVDQETGEVLGDEALSIDEVIEQAGVWHDESDFKVAMEKEAEGLHESAANAIEKWKTKIPFFGQFLENDATKLLNSESNVVKMIGANLMESSGGRYRKNGSAAMVNHLYQSRVASKAAPLETAFQDWAKAKGANALDRHWHGTAKDEFGKLVREEMTARRIDDVEVSADPHVKAAADALEARNKVGEEVLRGKDGEIAVKGAAETEFRRGYVQQQFHPVRLRQAVQTHGLKKMSEVLGRKIHRSLPHVPEEVTPKIAKAMLNRSLYKDADTEVSMTTLLSEDARATLTDVLKENSNMSDKEISSIVEKMKPGTEDEGRKGFLKKRIEVDMRGEEDGIDFMDLMDNDMSALSARYVRQVAGAGSLARMGITSKSEQTKLIDAAMKEQADLGVAKQVTREELEDMFTYFDPGPIAGGVSNTVRSVKAMTNMALLPQLAVTQMAETGASMAQVGVMNWFRTAPGVIRDMVSGKKNSETAALVDDLEFMLGDLGNEHVLFRDDLALDISKNDVNSVVQNETFIQKAGLKGQRLMNWMGGFYAMRSAQQRIHTAAFTNRLFKELRDGKLDDPSSSISKMMDDAGLSPQIRAELKRLVDNGTVEFGESGYVNRINSQQWDPVLIDQFSLAMHRNVNQVVQKTLAGEDSLWMHSSTGALTSHMLSFPLAAVEKQLTRNLRTNPELFYRTLMFSMATATAAYAVKQHVNGTAGDMTMKDAVIGGFGMGNITGFMPMFIDPLFYMAGADTGMTGKYGAQNPVELFTPAALSVGQRLFDLPGTAVSAATGEDLTNSQWRSLQTIPILGKFYGINAMLNSQKDQ